MKFGLILATRGNPQRAAAVIEAARFMSSGKHPVEYVISCDDDDLPTVEFFRNYPGVTVSCGPRPPGTMECLNRCVRAMDCDAYIGLADDGFPVTEDWDLHCADFLQNVIPTPELGLMAWTDSANPGQSTVMVATREWIAHTGRLQDDRFPFWFSDTCEAETWAFVTYRPMPLVPTLQIVSRSGRPNPRMRDIDFWWDFYIATRPERLETAKRIRAKLGRPDNDILLARTLELWRDRDAKGRENCREIAKLVAPREPDAGYRVAMMQARGYMAKLSQVAA